MKKLNHLAAVMIAAIAVYALAWTGPSCEASPAARPHRVETLQSVERGKDSLEGQYVNDDQVLRLRSSELSGEEFALNLQMRGASIDFVLDLRSRTAYFDAHGMVLSRKDRESMLGLAKQLALTLPGEKRQLPAHERFALLALEFLSEAPLGMRLDAMSFDASAPVRDDCHEALGGDPPGDREDCGRGRCWGPGCEGGGDDGILRLCGGCSWLTYPGIGHDYRRLGSLLYVHGYCENNVEAGCNLQHQDTPPFGDCLGRCGVGCGILGENGMGLYTKDCTEHDWCSWLHGTDLSGCADEFVDAADDYIRYAIAILTGDSDEIINCGGCRVADDY